MDVKNPFAQSLVVLSILITIFLVLSKRIFEVDDSLIEVEKEILQLQCERSCDEKINILRSSD